MSTHIMAKLAELCSNGDDADVTINCQGEVIKAHSLILGIGSEYFKTALNTSVGSNNKVLKVDECSPHVLATVVNFIYGIKIPEDLNNEDAKSLLAMADLYLMEELKGAVISLIATKQMNHNTILDISKMAEKYGAQELKELCCEFIFQNLKTLDKELLMELYETFPMLGKKALLELIEGNPQNSVDVANRDLGINLAQPFKKRGDFQSDDDYKGYLMTHMKPNMLVLCNNETIWDFGILGGIHRIGKGTIGRVISFDIQAPMIKWSNRSTSVNGSFLNLDLLTPPIATSLFND